MRLAMARTPTLAEMQQPGFRGGLDPKDQILEDLAGFSRDPLGFVLYAFPWEEPGSELERESGPQTWQIAVLTDVRDGLLTLDRAIQIAVSSGHGVGKSALVSWLILWAMSTFPDTRGVVTANTEKQLMTKTWVEMDKWYRLFIGREFFDKSATKLCSRDPEHSESWRFDVIPWSERNTEAFAGLHNKSKRLVIIFDEASAIPDIIYETTEGALTDTDTEILWLICGNPTRNTGRFRECFPGGRHAFIWKTHRVDSRTTTFANKNQIAQWVQAYGEDSDFIRVRVRGEFPRQAAGQFISSEMAAEAVSRDVQFHRFDAFVMGVDVARFGDDETVIWFRKGTDAKSLPPVILRGADTMHVAGVVSEMYHRYHADAVFVDGGGVGGGVVDRLRQLSVPAWDIQFGSKDFRGSFTEDNIRFANKRAEIWGYMREWLKTGAIPDDQELLSQLTAVEYTFNARDEIVLESKKSMKDRGLSSPDRADALALTFAFAVQANRSAGGEFEEWRKPAMALIEYDPFPAGSID